MSAEARIAELENTIAALVAAGDGIRAAWKHACEDDDMTPAFNAWKSAMSGTKAPAHPDATRLDWLTSKLNGTYEEVGHYISASSANPWEGYTPETPYYIGNLDRVFGSSLRAAIDAAMEANS